MSIEITGIKNICFATSMSTGITGVKFDFLKDWPVSWPVSLMGVTMCLGDWISATMLGVGSTGPGIAPTTQPTVKEAKEERKEKEPEISGIMCKCEMRTLLMHGCRCGAAHAEMSAKSSV